jgi:hypothetical protein
VSGAVRHTGVAYERQVMSELCGAEDLETAATCDRVKGHPGHAGGTAHTWELIASDFKNYEWGMAESTRAEKAEARVDELEQALVNYRNEDH